MYKQTKILTVIFFLVCFSITAQNIALPTDYVRNTLSGKNDIPANVEGTPYINETFQKGTVSIGDKSFTTSIRYNGYQDVFEIKNENGEVTSLLRRPDIIVTIGGDIYKIQPYLNNGEKAQGYFKHVNSPKNQTLLLLKQTVEFREAKKARNTYSQDQPANFKPAESYYLKLENSPAEEIRLRRRDILKILDDPKVEDYVKENKFRLKDEAEVIKTLAYYDSL